MDFKTLTEPAGLVAALDAAGGKLEQSPRELLDVLIEDLKQDSNLDRWAEVGLADMLARPENFAVGGPARPSRWRPRWLPSGSSWERAGEAVLGVLVFVPLLITWIGLFAAAQAYGNLASSDKQEATRPFLQLWESGFDGRLSHWFRFGDIAFDAVMFISMLLLLALVHSASRYQVQRTEDRLQAEAEQHSAQLAAVLTRVQLYLVGYRLTSPARFTTALTESADALRTLITDAREAQESVTTVLAEAKRISASLDNAADKMNSATGVIGEAATRVEEIMRDGTSALTNLQRTGIDGLKSVVEDGVKSLREGQQAALAAVEASTRAGVEALESTRTATQAAVDAAIRATNDAAQRNADALNAVQERLGRAGEQVETAVRDLTEVQQRLSERSELVVAAAGQMTDSMQTAVRQSSDSIRLIADQANVSLGELSNSVERWDQAAAHWVTAAAAVETRVGALTQRSIDGRDGHDGRQTTQAGQAVQTLTAPARPTYQTAGEPEDAPRDGGR